MSEASGPVDEASTTRTDGSFVSLARWYWPYVRPFRLQVILVSIGIAAVLACQAFIPLTVEGLLHHGEWDIPALVTLLVLVVVQLSAGHFSHIVAHRIASGSAMLLRLRVFDRTMHSRTLRHDGLVRSSIVSRHTTDVDHVSEAFEQTANLGIPGVLRIVISLSLLTVVEWRSGLVMTAAAILFIVLRRWVGTSLVIADRDRLAASSRVGESVDEALTAPRTIAGMHLSSWIEGRFARRAEALEDASHRQGRKVADLVTGAHMAGLIGLVAVACFGIAMGGEGLAAVAAALLYVEGVVKGLEALPPWVRCVQLGIVSRHRIDHILVDADVVDQSIAAFGDTSIPHSDLVFPEHAVVGLVTPNGFEADIALATISGETDPNAWRITLEGHRVRAAGTRLNALHIPQEPLAFNVSIADLFKSVIPNINETEMRRLLGSVGLDYLAVKSEDLHRNLGPVGTRLTIDERQRLALAMALTSDSELVLVGPLLALADTDTALVLIHSLRERGFPAVIVTARTAEVAAEMDLVIFATATGMRMDTHERLLVDSPEYSQLWSTRLSSVDVDLSVLGIDPETQGTMLTRLVTESYGSGETIYREGAPADRIIFTISGKVEILASDASGGSRRVAVLGPGNHCGDLRLTPGEVRGETAVALEDSVVRSLSREAISAGMSGLLDRTATERRIVSAILRSRAGTLEELTLHLHDLSESEVLSALALLKSDGAIVEEDGRYRTVQKRATKTGAADILDRIGGL